MKRSLGCPLALVALITLFAGCADVDPVRPASSSPDSLSAGHVPPPVTEDESMIYLLRVGDTSAFALTGGSNPVWSPDGSRILLLSKRDGNYELYVVNRSGDGLTRLTSNGMPSYSSWSPDGSRIAWVRGDGRLMVMNADGSHNITVAKSTPGYSPFRQAVWSPDGRELAFAVGDGTMHVANADGSRDMTLSSGGGVLTVLEPPTWSPDGKRIAFVGWSQCNLGSCLAIYSMSAQGGEETLLAGGDAEDEEYAVWSPDGRSIAFLSYPGGDCPPDWCGRGPNVPDLYVMNADGTGRRRILIGAEGLPAWSRDGATLTIATLDSSGGSGLVAVPLDGGAPQRLSSSGGRLSPDGQWIAFVKWK